MLNTDFSQRFSQQSQLLQQLQNSLTPTLAAGPSAQGWSPQEAAAISTATINNTAAANRTAQQSVANFGAGRASDSGLTSGVQKQLQAGVASSSANALAQQQTNNTIANYAQGNKNYQTALAGLSALSGQFDPTGFGSQAIGANSNAFGQANQIQQQKNQEAADIAGGITSLGMDAASFGAGALGGGGFDFAGGLQALTGKG